MSKVINYNPQPSDQAGPYVAGKFNVQDGIEIKESVNELYDLLTAMPGFVKAEQATPQVIVVDDVLSNWLEVNIVAGKTLADYEGSLDITANPLIFTPLTTPNKLLVGDVSIPAGKVGVRLKETAIRRASAWATNAAPFTQSRLAAPSNLRYIISAGIAKLSWDKSTDATGQSLQEYTLNKTAVNPTYIDISGNSLVLEADVNAGDFAVREKARTGMMASAWLTNNELYQSTSVLEDVVFDLVDNIQPDGKWWKLGAEERSGTSWTSNGVLTAKKIPAGQSGFIQFDYMYLTYWDGRFGFKTIPTLGDLSTQLLCVALSPGLEVNYTDGTNGHYEFLNGQEADAQKLRIYRDGETGQFTLVKIKTNQEMVTIFTYPYTYQGDLYVHLALRGATTSGLLNPQMFNFKEVSAPVSGNNKVLLVSDGNSIVAGNGDEYGLILNENNPSFTGVARHKLGELYTAYNFGGYGQAIYDMLLHSGAKVDPVIADQQYNKKYLLAWEATNQIAGFGSDGATAHAMMKQYFAARRAANPTVDYKVLTMPLLPRTAAFGSDGVTFVASNGLTGAQGFEYERQVFNNLQLSDPYYDILVDVNALNLTLNDGVHPSGQGQAAIAEAVVAAIADDIQGNQPSAPESVIVDDSTKQITFNRNKLFPITYHEYSIADGIWANVSASGSVFLYENNIVVGGLKYRVKGSAKRNPSAAVSNSIALTTPVGLTDLEVASKTSNVIVDDRLIYSTDTTGALNSVLFNQSIPAGSAGRMIVRQTSGKALAYSGFYSKNQLPELIGTSDLPAGDFLLIFNEQEDPIDNTFLYSNVTHREISGGLSIMPNSLVAIYRKPDFTFAMQYSIDGGNTWNTTFEYPGDVTFSGQLFMVGLLPEDRANRRPYALFDAQYQIVG
ncbi:SGNH/GDSL hydrolase family protein [Mucilaginibacter sp. CSA2-8R]|uniref:SGNH/GDSL hydrolase family protein n=1 Tax=Mucilaginibacter sp. CSA2-8R TaxID=3141542 RepID=UPI00315CF946